MTLYKNPLHDKTTPPLIIEPDKTATTAIIFMHGLGADAHDFESIVPLLPIDKIHARMIFPNAPIRPITVNQGMPMRGWYDIKDFNLREADQAGITASMAYIFSLIDEQITAGIPAKNIVLAGFSQGGAMALHAGLRYDQTLAGILALSCYVLDKNTHTNPANQHTPILQVHGRNDAVVPYDLGFAGAQFLESQGHNISFLTYPIGHEVVFEEVSAIADWLLSLFDPSQ